MTQDFGTVTFNGKEYTFTGDADLTNRCLPQCYRQFQNTPEGEEYDFEMSAPAMDADGNKYWVYWIFSAIKGDEAELDSYDYDDVDRVEVR